MLKNTSVNLEKKRKLMEGQDDSVSLQESNDSDRDSDLDVFDPVAEDSDYIPSPKAKKDKKKNVKIVQGEASTSDVKPAADESQIVSIPKEREGDAEIASVPEELTQLEPYSKFYEKNFCLVCKYYTHVKFLNEISAEDQNKHFEEAHLMLQSLRCRYCKWQASNLSALILHVFENHTEKTKKPSEKEDTETIDATDAANSGGKTIMSKVKIQIPLLDS